MLDLVTDLFSPQNVQNKHFWPIWDQPHPIKINHFYQLCPFSLTGTHLHPLGPTWILQGPFGPIGTNFKRFYAFEPIGASLGPLD